MMMALDQFVFGLDNLAYQELQRKTGWRHVPVPRVGARAARQFLGPDDDTISLSGVLVPEFMGREDAMQQLRDMGDTGDAYAMVDGEGTVYGAFVIESVTEGQTLHTQEGRARRIDFTVELVRVDDTLATSSEVNPQWQDEEE